MTKYSVEVHYQASVYFDIEADSEEEASAEALRQANAEVPYDDLYTEVVYVEVNDDEVEE